MRRLVVTFVVAAFAAGSAFAQSAAGKQDFVDRFVEMQVQSGAAFPNAPAYEGARAVAAESPVPAGQARGTERKRADFADRFAEMQRESGAKFVTALPYEGAGTTALAAKESDRPTPR